MATKQVTPAEDEGARSFSVLLQSFGEGAFHSDVSEELRDLVKRLEAHAEDFGKAKGSLTLKLSITADREGSIVTISPEVATKAPKPARKAGVFWVNKAGNLVSENPKSKQLPLRAVAEGPPREAAPASTAEPRTV